MSKRRTIPMPGLAEAFKALGHPHRLHIFHRLSSCCAPGTVCPGEEAIRRCVGELAAELDIAPSTVSHHLKELTRAGLIATERCGREIHCWVEPEVLHALGDFFRGYVAPVRPAQGRKTA